MLDVMDTFVCDPCDSLDVSGLVRLTELFVDEGSGIMVVLLDACPKLFTCKVGAGFGGDTYTEPDTVGVCVDAHIVEVRVHDAVVELLTFWASQYGRYARTQYSYCELLVEWVGTCSDLVEVGISAPCMKDFTETLGILYVVLPSAVG